MCPPSLLRAAAVATLIVPATLPLVGKAADEKSELQWHAVEDWGVEGQGWPADAMAEPFDRLPAKAESIVRDPVWKLSRDSAGLLFRFNTDATEITIDYTLGDDRLALPHMPATGASGVDLYALADDGTWKWVSVTRPASTETEHTVSGLDPGMRSYMAYLPLYNAIRDISVGVPADAEFQPVAPRSEKPIVFYGTSITHGACAPRPGLVHTAILGRRLDRPVVNLGFSGNGEMETAVGALLTEIDAAAYVIDCLPNMTGDQVEERAVALVNQIRDARPDTPIVLVEDRTYGNAWILESRRRRHRDSRAALIRAFDALVSTGVSGLHYLEGEGLLGEDTAGTTDGSHPNALGFMRQADAFEPVLREALGLE